jgi:hypothetical protein
MFTSLEKLDLGFAKPGDPTRWLVQTDHRTAIEISDDAPLAIVFAVTRCLVARTIAAADPKLQPFRVVYQLAAEPPAFLAYAVGAAGAVIARDVDQVLALSEPAPRWRELATLLDDACRRLAHSARLEPSSQALAEYERGVSVPSNDEYELYRAIVMLGALASEILRARFPDQDWTWHPAPADVIPFRFGPSQSEPANRLAVFELAKRYLLGRDPTDAPSLLLGMIVGDVKQIVIE